MTHVFGAIIGAANVLAYSEQISAEQIPYLRSICRWSNCRRSKCRIFGAIVGGANVGGAMSLEQLLSAEQMSYFRSICRRSNCRGSNCRRSKCRRSKYRRSNCRRSKCRRSKCRRSKCLGAFVAEHLSHFPEQLSAEHMSPEYNVVSPAALPSLVPRSRACHKHCGLGSNPVIKGVTRQ